MSDFDLRVISLGAGVQSSTLSLMCQHGVFERPDFALFADTLAEGSATYTWLDQLEQWLSFPVVRVSRGDLGADQLRLRQHQKIDGVYMKTLIPAYIEPTPTTRLGMLGRKCTADYKVQMILRELKTRLGGRKRNGARAQSWIGISTDEAHRMKPSQDSATENRWPLIELGMSRADCLAWMREKGYPEPPRSSCYFCPFHSDAEWEYLRTEQPEDFARARQYEIAMQGTAAGITIERAKLNGKLWLHSACKPIDEIDFTAKDKPHQLDLWGNECEGLCGV